MGKRRRWPSWVYGVGATPDPRFSLANERTFLAWVRTALALLAGGVALHAVGLDGPAAPQSALAVALVVLGLPGTTALAWLALSLGVVAALLAGAGRMSAKEVGFEDQCASTLLAWRRTSLSLVAAGLLAGHLTVADAGRPALAVSLLSLASR